MKPYTDADLERDMREAIDSGDTARMAVLSALVDARDAAGKALPPVLSAALWYAEQGLHVFALQPGSKLPHPRTHGCSDATTDQEQVRSWWERWPDSNVAIATGYEVDVIDFDGPQAHAAWGAKYGETYGGMPVLGTVSTPRPGGLHVYVPATGEGNRADLLPHVDWRGLGGYVVAPPSTTEVGTYLWLRALQLGPPS